MTTLPNANAQLVGPDGRPTSVLQELIPILSAQDVVMNNLGQATPLLRVRLQAMVADPLPNVSVSLFNPDGTPTRVMTHILAGLA